MPRIDDVQAVPGFVPNNNASPVYGGKSNSGQLFNANSKEAMPAPEYAGKVGYDPKVPIGKDNASKEIRSMFGAEVGTQFRVVMLDPRKVIHIPMIDQFFNRSDLVQNNAFKSKTCNSGMEALNSAFEGFNMINESSELQDVGPQGNRYAVILAKDVNGNVTMRGVVQAEINQSSTRYFIAENPSPTTMYTVAPEIDMSRDN